MTNLILSPTCKYFRIGDKDDYVVLDGGRVIGRASPANAGRSSMVLDDNSFGYSALARQAGLWGQKKGPGNNATHLALTTAYPEWEPVRDAVLKITFAQLLRSCSRIVGPRAGQPF